jgi:hypothetical protein
MLIMKRLWQSALLISTLSIAASVLSFILSGQVVPKIIPNLEFDSSLSSWSAFDLKSPVWDIWFDSDTQIVVANMIERDFGHFTLYKHPLFSIIFYPLTSLLQIFIPDDLTAVRAVFAINAFASMSLLGALLKRMRMTDLDTALCCLLFMVSSTMIFWFTVPERFPLGMTTLLVALHAAMSAPPRSWLGYLAHAGASIATLSTTITNWAAGLLATAASTGLLDRPHTLLSTWRGNRRTIWIDTRKFAIVSILALTLAAILAIIQNEIFGEASLFFNVPFLLKEGEFVLEYKITAAWMRPLSLLSGPVVVGTLGTWQNGAGPLLTADNIMPSTWTGAVALVLWAVLFMRGLTISILTVFGRRKAADPIGLRRLLTAALISLLFFTLLHSMYGYVTFLYTPHLMPYCLVILAVNFIVTDAESFLAKPAIIRSLLGILIGIAFLHNYDVFQQSVAFVTAVSTLAS